MMGKKHENDFNFHWQTKDGMEKVQWVFCFEKLMKKFTGGKKSLMDRWVIGEKNESNGYQES